MFDLQIFVIRHAPHFLGLDHPGNVQQTAFPIPQRRMIVSSYPVNLANGGCPPGLQVIDRISVCIFCTLWAAV